MHTYIQKNWFLFVKDIMLKAKVRLCWILLLELIQMTKTEVL